MMGMNIDRLNVAEYHTYPVEKHSFSNGVNGTGIFYAERAGHGANIAEPLRNVNTKDLTL